MLLNIVVIKYFLNHQSAVTNSHQDSSCVQEGSAVRTLSLLPKKPGSPRLRASSPVPAAPPGGANPRSLRGLLQEEEASADPGVVGLREGAMDRGRYSTREVVGLPSS